MLALIFLAIFGFLAVTVGGIMALSVPSTQQYTRQLIAETEAQMAQARDIILTQYVPDYMQSPLPADNANTNQNVGPYICGIANIRQVITCTGTGATAVAADAWGRAITGKVFRANNQLFYTRGGLSFRAPVTAYAILSAGPNGVVNTTVPANPTALSHLTGISVGGDDILLTFTDLPAQRATANAIDEALTKIGLSAQRNYQQQFAQFKSQLDTIYANTTILSRMGGSFDISSEVARNIWKAWPGAANVDTIPANPATITTTFRNSVIAPKFQNVLTGPGGTLNVNLLGANGEADFIQRSIPSGGAMTLNAIVGDTNLSSYGINDALVFSVTLTGTVWQQAVTPNCALANPVNCIKVKGTL